MVFSRLLAKYERFQTVFRVGFCQLARAISLMKPFKKKKAILILLGIAYTLVFILLILECAGEISYIDYLDGEIAYYTKREWETRLAEMEARSQGDHKHVQSLLLTNTHYHEMVVSLYACRKDAFEFSCWAWVVKAACFRLR